MTERNAAFVGSIPENYDLYLGPALFEPYAADMAGRVEVAGGASVLEVACGTGILTRCLGERLPAGARLVATDLNQAMLDYAARKLGAGASVEWRQADACELPFEDESFDAVVCQFGLMFVPDKPRACAEARRVLKPGGTFYFSVWDALERNDLAHAAHETISTFFPDDPPNFYQVPFSLHDPSEVASLLAGAGFRNPQTTLLALESVSPSAAEAARGLVEGNPVRGAIEERRPEALAEIVAAVAGTVAGRCGDRPVRGTMRAHVWTATR